MAIDLMEMVTRAQEYGLTWEVVSCYMTHKKRGVSTEQAIIAALDEWDLLTPVELSFGV